MAKRFVPILVAALLAAAVAPADAQSATPAPAPPAAVAGLSTDIAVVRVVGPWSTGEQRGYSRLIEVLNNGAMSLYVQWIVQGGGDADQVVQTVKVEGAAAAPNLPLARLRIDAGANDAEVTFQLPATADADQQTWVLDIGPPGQAQFGRPSH